MDRPLLSEPSMLSESAMLRILLALLALSAAQLVAAPASAQIAFVVSSLTGPGGVRDTNEGRARGFNAADCGDPDMAMVRVDAPSTTSTTVDFVDLWVTTGSTDCSTTAARDPDGPTCDYVGVADFDDSDRFFTLALSDLIAADPSICGSGAPQNGITVQLYAFTTGNMMELGEVDATNSGSVTIKVDATVPSSPTVDAEDQMLSGDSQVNIQWNRVTDNDPRYVIYVGGACGSGSLPDTDNPLLTTDINAQSAGLDPAEDLGLETGESVAVFVAALDIANNRGVPSDEICITRVQVSGYCAVAAEMGEACPEGCSVGPAGTGGSNVGWIALAFAALFVRRRRTR